MYGWPFSDALAHSHMHRFIIAPSLQAFKYPWNEDYYVYNDHNIALCSNEQPNFMNFEHCKLSYEENTCVKEYSMANVDVALVVPFNDDTLAQLHNITLASYQEANGTDAAVDSRRYIYAISGLRYDESNTDGITAVLPCGSDNPTSRWRRVDINATECTNTLHSQSVLVLRRALETSNDENVHFRDIYLWNDNIEDGCDPSDALAYGMLIMTNEGCWENVHPDLM